VVTNRSIVNRIAHRVRLLAFSDVHRDERQAAQLADMSADADVVVAAGDFASVHRGLEQLIDVLVVIEKPTVLVPGNNETEQALREACGGWRAATVLHGEGTEIDGVAFWGLGGGVPPTPWPWSFDLTEAEAAENLAGCPEDAVLVVHSPPKGHLDGDRSLGSESVFRTIEGKRPRVAICGHIHDCAGEESTIGSTRVLNVGPAGMFVDV
jgi:Icc-related predicted phosphoesterase